jgi:hypothetical protein
VFRLFKRVPSLKIIIEGVIASMPGVANAFVVSQNARTSLHIAAPLQAAHNVPSRAGARHSDGRLVDHGSRVLWA